jgi:hypothetical protein
LSNVNPDRGNNYMLTDGQLSTSVTFSFMDYTSTCDTYDYLWFSFVSPLALNSVVIKYPPTSGFSSYMACWDLLVSNQADPGFPDPNSKKWQRIEHQENTLGGDLTISFPSVNARHVAVLFYQDGQVNIYETFEIAEIEAWNEQQGAPKCP